MSLGLKLRAMIKHRHYSLRKFAAAADLSVDTLRRLKEMKKIEDMRDGTYAAIAKGFGMTVPQLDEAVGLAEGGGLPAGFSHDPYLIPSEKRVSWLPEVGKAAAGKPSDFEHDVLGDRNIPGTLYHAPEEFPAIIRAVGDSMSGLIEDGDIVVIARKFWRPARSGDIVAVSFAQEGGHAIKWLEILPNGDWKLSPQNPKAPPARIYPKSMIHASAVVVGWYHPLHRPRRAK